MRRLYALVAPAALIALILGAWQAACAIWAIPPFLLPAPTAVAAAARDNLPVLTASAWTTLSVALIAWALASLIACSVALAVSVNTLLEDAVRPLAVILQVTPIVAIAPLVNIWAGLDHPQRGGWWL